MDRWLRFFTERFPLVNSAVLVSGISLSGLYLSGIPPFSFLSFILSFVGIVFVLALLCLMEDVKNLEKDRIAHSNRPLPKGLIKKSEAIFVISAMEIILFLYALLLWVLLGRSAAISYLAVVAYFWLLNKDFGIKVWLSRRPIIYGFLYHIIIILLAIFAVEIHPMPISSAAVWSFALLLFGAFFCQDICSKLNPHAHPVLGTYIHFYG
ncbi:MAG TPA: UbiA family prenyltransferase, partial [Parachlamydiaceae bacterium]|nr:UbiA family prenyltransferase [Parachlamydiaceae bacterium]